MPKVLKPGGGYRHFSYTDQGKIEAENYAQKIGGKVIHSSRKNY